MRRGELQRVLPVLLNAPRAPHRSAAWMQQVAVAARILERALAQGTIRAFVTVVRFRVPRLDVNGGLHTGAQDVCEELGEGATES